jgi:hypothetical protein
MNYVNGGVMGILPRGYWLAFFGFLILVICGFAAAQTPSSDSTQPVVDAAAQDLLKAKDAHKQAVETATKKMLAVIDERINAAADAGDFPTVQSLRAAKDSIATDGTLSDDVKDPVVLAAKEKYDRAIGLARSRLKNAYDVAVSSYTRARQFDKAQATQDEFNSLAVTDPSMKPHIVDLLRLVDPKHDGLAGKWYLQNGSLWTEASPFSQIRFPYRPPAEYDFHLEYDREHADFGIGVAICHLGDVFDCSMPTARDSVGTGTFYGVLDSVKFDAPPSAATHCDVIVQIRAARLTVVINGEKCFDRQMPSWELSRQPDWLNGPGRYGLGVADRYGRTTITKAEVTEITGVGEVLDEGTPK